MNPPHENISPSVASAEPARAGRWARFFARLNASSVATTIGVGITVAVVLNPIFVTPFPVLLGRTLFVAMVLLLVYAGARGWPATWLPRWTPRWLRAALPLVAVGLAAPLCTLAVYMLAVDFNVGAFFGAPARVSGYLWIAGSALVLGLLLAAGALVRERLAQAEREALQFALERSRLEKQAVDARLALLQAQIEPHFLFNTLANVQALVEGGSPRAADVLKSLIAYLRAAMPRLHEAEPTLAGELALVRSYLELMQLRMPDRLQFNIDVPAALQARPFPPMALLTLVENAVRHGIDPAEDGGRIAIAAERNEASGALHLWVADSGVGLSETATPGTGLSNLRQRLQAQFGLAAELRLSEHAPHGLRAEIVIPVPASEPRDR
jgi:two-component sensor histidine kinase